ncbi:SusC/RagA family TonB-linked outer membrane protein [Flavitalea flava]
MIDLSFFAITWQRARLSLPVIFLLMSMAFCSALRAQNKPVVNPLDKKISFSVTNMPFPQAVKLLRDQARLAITDNLETLKTQPNVTLSVTNEPARNVLAKMLVHTNLQYIEGTDGSVMIIPRKKNSDPVKGETWINISGLVTDNKGNLLANASIELRVGDEHVGARTDEKGGFAFEAPIGAHLKFSYLGMKTTERIVRNSSLMRIALDSAPQEMTEYVVNGYQRVDKRLLASSTFTLKPEQFLEPGAHTVDQMLQGKVPGLMVINNSGSPSSTPTLRIRGTNTLLGTTAPIWVVDGIIKNDPVELTPLQTSAVLESAQQANFSIVGNAISGVSPLDIESITFLKDAAATAIYGVRAANGVIIVTTKHGKAGATQMNYSVNLGLQAAPNYGQINGMNSRERIDVSREIWAKGIYYQFNPIPASYEGAIAAFKARQITQDQFAAEVASFETMNTDWLKLVARNQFSEQHHLSFSGGSGKTTYYASFGYDAAKGNYTGDNMNLYTGMINLNSSLNNRVTFSMGMAGSYRGANSFYAGVNPSVYALRTSRAISADSPYVTGFSIANLSTINRPLHYSIQNELAHTGNTSNTKDYSINANLNYRILNGLNYSATIGGQANSTTALGFADAQSWNVAQIRGYDYGSVVNGSQQQVKSSLPFGGIAYPTTNGVSAYTVRHTLSFDRSLFASRDNFSVSLTQEFQSIHQTGQSSLELGYYPDRGQTYYSAYYNAGGGAYINPNTTVVHTITQTNQTTNTLSWLGILSYSLNKRYIFNANFRTDGSNRFGQYSNQRFLPNWSVAGRWEVTQEPWLQKSNVINGLSLRASFGTQGNVISQVGPNLIASYPTSPVDPGSNELVLNLQSLPYPYLRWEKTIQTNFGADLSLFNGRISMTGDVWTTHNSNLLLSRSLPEEYGIPSMFMNYGTMFNWGIDLSANFILVRTKNFSWSQNFSFGKTFNQVNQASITNTYSDYLNGTAIITGKPAGSFWSYSFAGLDHNYGYPVFNNFGAHPIPSNTVPSSYLTYSGLQRPLINSGTTTSLRYKQLSIMATFAFSFGNTKRLYPIYPSIGGGVALAPPPEMNLVKDLNNRWKNPGDEMHTNIPSYSNYDETGGGVILPGASYKSSPYSLYDQSSARLYNADFLRCNMISVNYNLPARIMSRWPVKGMSLGGSVSKPFVIASKALHGQDPEIDNTTGLAMPVIKAYNVNVSVSF